MKKEDKKILRRVLYTAALVLFLGWFVFWPLNKYIESPGSADNLRSYITIPGHPDKQKGSFMITSVYLQRARPMTYLWAKVTPYASIENADDVTGGQSGKTFDRVQNFYMQSAINQAIEVAFKADHRSVKTDYLGIYVLQVQNNSKFKGQIKVGDTITQVNGHHFNTASGYQKYIGKQKVGSPLKVTYEHNGKQKEVTKPLVKISRSRAGIGIILTDNTKVHTTPKVTVNPGQLGGPSGGLMFALQIYQQMSGDNLRHGQRIAGTGTINKDGSVGEIGGIDKKVVAAHRAGAKVFLAPYVKPSKLILQYEEGHQTNYQMAKKTAHKYAPEMKVVPVKTFDDAVQYLRKHPA